jgi:hypothetical protein
MQTMVAIWLLDACAPGASESSAPAGICSELFYVDHDGDGHGDPTSATNACELPVGHTASSDDCDDALPEVHPGAGETCNDRDDDCDGSIDDEPVDPAAWYLDADGDGFGDDTGSVEACDVPVGFVAAAGDCDDAAAGVHPGAGEICDGADDDCDGLVDALDDDLAGPTWFGDADGDGFGDALAGVVACGQPSGTVANDSDCNDTSASIRPSAPEVCNGVDDDCDLLVDDDDEPVEATLTFYADVDGDGYGDGGSTVSDCILHAGYTDDALDCDDGDASVGPAQAYFDDVDGDGYGDGYTHLTCMPDGDDVLIEGDCAAYDATIHPGAVEICDERDDDCNGSRDEADSGLVDGKLYRDADADGYGDDADTIVSCDAHDGYLRVGGDCDESDADIHPTAREYCDGVDNDCTGLPDDGVVDVDWYRDADEDGYGDPRDVLSECVQPSGYVLDASDCDDGDTSISPIGIEVCDDDVDQDCDGSVDNCAMTIDFADAIVSPELGSAVASADVDGDGIADLLVGAPSHGRSVGRAYILLGPVTGSIAAEDGLVIDPGSLSSGGALGAAVAGGDANDDGTDDLVVVEKRTNSMYVLLGPVTASGDTAGADTTFVDPSRRDGILTQLAMSSDADGDGTADLVVGAGHTDATYVISGTSSGSADLARDATYVFEGGGMGYGNVDLGDTDGDGIDDLALGATGAGAGGSEYIVSGGLSPGTYDTALVASAVLVGPEGSQGMGWSAAVLDYDGDGNADVVVGAWAVSVLSDSGAVYGFFGPLSGVVTAPDVKWTQTETTDYDAIGMSVAAGDLDGDSQADVVIGAPGWGPRFAGSSPGCVWVQLGPASGTVEVDGLLALPASSLGDQTGTAVAVIGDWSGDDVSELAIGSTGAVVDSGTGTVDVFFSENFY